MKSVTEEQRRKDLIQTRGSRSVKAAEKKSGLSWILKAMGRLAESQLGRLSGTEKAWIETVKDLKGVVYQVQCL